MRGRRTSRDERELWRRATRDVTAWRKPESPEEAPSPMRPQGAETLKRRAKAAPQQRTGSAGAQPELAPGDVIGVDRRLAERLRRGRLPIQSTLDLHGLTQSEAHAAVDRFIARGAERGLRAVLIVTGKGREAGGVLKSALPRWLNEAPMRGHVLAMAEAQPEHGGAGALYVLLRRRRGSK